VKRVKLGDLVTLPSGVAMRATAVADRSRPWAAVQVGRHWHVVRKGEESGVEHYFAGRLIPLQLDEVDAVAAAMILNTVQT
jgi:hypothetical protein